MTWSPVPPLETATYSPPPYVTEDHAPLPVGVGSLFQLGLEPLVLSVPPLLLLSVVK